MGKKHFIIHPSNGFLNTDFVLWSTDPKQDINILVQPENKTLYLPTDRTHIITQFDKGEHKLIYQDVNGEKIQEEDIIVENSIKAGGSVVQNRVILKHWIIIIMHDRTYFHNRRTKEEFVEYKIHPDNIIELTEELLCFISSGNCSVFNMTQMQTEYTIDNFDIIYNVEGCLIYKEGDIIYLKSGNYNKISKFKFSSYEVDKKNNKLYIHNKFDNNLKIVDLITTQVENKKIPERFNEKEILFYNSIFIIYSTYVKDLQISSIDAPEIIYTIPASKIVELFNDEIQQEVSTWTKEIKIARNTSINSFSLQSGFLFIKHYSSKTKKDISYVTFDFDITHLQELDDGEMLYENANFFVYQIKREKKEDTIDLIIIDFSQKSINKVQNVNVIQHNDDYLYYQFDSKSNKYTIYNLYGDVIISGTNIDIDLYKFAEYGRLKVSNKIYVYTNGSFSPAKINEYPSSNIINNNDEKGSFFITEDECRPLPYNIKLWSGNMDCLIFEENNTWVKLEWNSDDKRYNYDLIFKNFDRTYFKEAMFCEDSKKLFCLTNDNTYCYYDIETRNVVKFEMDKTVVRNFNANQLLVTGDKQKNSDEFRRVVFKDPVTLKEITPDYLSQYAFFSIDKRYFVKYDSKRPLTKSYYSKNEEGKTISIRYFLVHDTKNEIDIKVFIHSRLRYYNYITFSYDSKYIAIVGATYDSGYFQIFNLEKLETVFEYPSENRESKKSFVSGAIWLASFNKNNSCAIYNSNPSTYIFEENNNFETPTCIRQRSFLCFSPSGKFVAMSCQGYNAYANGNSHWGHQKSTKVYIGRIDKIDEELGPYEDLGNNNISRSTMKNVGSVAFSQDEKKLLVVADDGTFVIRNLDLCNDSLWHKRGENINYK